MERRKYRRLMVPESVVSCEKLKGENGSITSDSFKVLRVFNVSTEGISLLLNQPLDKSEKIQIKILLPEPYGVIQTSAEILSSGLNGTNGDNKSYSYRLKFLPANSAVDKTIRDLSSDFTWLIDRRRPTRKSNSLEINIENPPITHRLSYEDYAIQFRQAKLDDIDELLRVERLSWPEGMRATEEMLKARIAAFPEGVVCAYADGHIRGYVAGEIIEEQLLKDYKFTWNEITDGGHIRNTHNSHGNTFYGVTLSVLPENTSSVAVKLLKTIGKFIIRKDLKQVVFGCRIPDYHAHAGKMNVEDYIKATTKSGRPLDRELFLYKKANLTPIAIIPNYYPDSASLSYGVIVNWENPFYRLKENLPFFIYRVNIHFT